MSNSENPDAPIELSNEELAEISGGIDIIFSGSMFEQSDSLLIQDTCSSESTNSSLTKSSRTSASTFQFVGLGFESVNDILAVFAGLAQLFGKR
jgi:bacteriocin-like protein